MDNFESFVCHLFARSVPRKKYANTPKVNDATILFRDMAGDAATNAASRVRPGEEDLAQIDRPAEDNVWHDAPDMSKDTVKSKLHEYYKGNPKEDIRSAANQGTSQAHPSGINDPRDLATTAAQDAQQRDGGSGVDAVGGAQSAKDTLKRNVDQNIDDETKEKARQRREEYRERLRNYFNRKMPQERREQTIWRLKVCRSQAVVDHISLTSTQKMILECQQHPDYYQAVNTLLDLAEEYGNHANRLARGGTDTVKGARSNLVQAETDLKVRHNPSDSHKTSLLTVGCRH
jgi:hypothetical protein